jgi:signal transduction histidine kinase
MARRILLTMLGLVGVLLISTVVPLGLITTGHERGFFQADTVFSAGTLASYAEDKIADHAQGSALTRTLTRARRLGEQVRVYDATGHLVAGNGGPGLAVSAAMLARVVSAGNVTITEVSQVGDRLRVVVPVRNDDGNGIVGAVVLARSTVGLDQRLRTLWLWHGLVALAGLAAAAVAAAGVARWASRPLNALDDAAQRLGGGALDTRSPVGDGPPEVRRLARNFNTMAGRLEALVHGHRAAMADVSHQLRTPLTALRLRLELMAQDADPMAARDLADAQHEISRLSRLVDGLLAVARAENVVVEPVPIAVDVIIRDRATAWRPVAEERAVLLEQACTGPIRAMAGAGHLEQILDNLLANALEAVPSGGRIEVSASPHGGATRVVVADDGPGMSATQQEQAFRRFASTTPGGAGLGLAIVHRLVTSNGGCAVLSETPGGGLTVTMDLPATAQDPADAP